MTRFATRVYLLIVSLQSGNPADPHYRDLMQLWANGKYFPIFYSREKIETVIEKKTVLAPSSTTQ